MRRHRVVPWALPVLAFLCIPVDAAVTVAFDHPDRYVDAGDFDLDSRQVLFEVRRHLERLGDRYLSSRDTLRIEILDMRLAGQPRMTRGPNWGVRVMSGDADWPWIEVRYTLLSGGSIVAQSTDETIVDRTYLRRIDRDYSAVVSLPYEKRMLDEWFKTRFGNRKLADY